MSEERTEKATPRRRQKAREKGQVARSRELSAALAVLAVIFVVAWQPLVWRGQWRSLLSQLVVAATSGQVEVITPLLQHTAWIVGLWALPAMGAAWGISLLSSVAQGGFIFTAQALTPKFSKLNPVSNIGKLFSLGALRNSLKSLIPMSFIAYFFVGLMTRDWNQIMSSSYATPAASVTWVLSRLFEIAWKAGLVFLVWSLGDYMFERFNLERQLRMSRQEIRQEGKDIEGNPLIKGRIRRLQRSMRRRMMMKDVARATVVVVNPTHYAIAIEYRLESMAAPIVLAKGRNLLAQRIKKEALWHDVPIVENPPLAQALYRSVEVGEAIPAKLYVAVAEILAFIFKAQGRAPERRAPQQQSTPRLTGN